MDTLKWGSNSIKHSNFSHVYFYINSSRIQTSADVLCIWLFTDNVSAIYSVITVTNCGMETKILLPAGTKRISHDYAFRVIVKPTQPYIP
jgi:hypothetical protein